MSVAIGVIAVAVVLGRVAQDGADPCSRRASDQSSFDAAAEDGAERRSPRSTDERAFARSYATLIIPVVLAPPRVAPVAVIAAPDLLICAIVELASVITVLATALVAIVVRVVLSGCGKAAGADDQSRAK